MTAQEIVNNLLSLQEARLPVNRAKLQAEIEQLKTSPPRQRISGYRQNARTDNLSAGTETKWRRSMRWRQQVLDSKFDEEETAWVKFNVVGLRSALTKIFFKEGQPMAYLERGVLYPWRPHYQYQQSTPEI